MWRGRKPDPRLKKKGGKFVCVICGNPLNSLCVKDSDPFCTSNCAREFHGTQINREKVSS
jgi:hypothetical protein